MVLMSDRRSYQGQDAIASEVFDRAAKLAHDFADDRVVVFEQLHDLLGSAGFRKSGEAPKVTRDHRQLRAVSLHRARKPALAHQPREVRRHEASEKLAALALEDVVAKRAKEKDHLTDREADRLPSRGHGHTGDPERRRHNESD